MSSSTLVLLIMSPLTTVALHVQCETTHTYTHTIMEIITTRMYYIIGIIDLIILYPLT